MDEVNGIPLGKPKVFPAMGMAKRLSQVIAEMTMLKALYGDVLATVNGHAGVSLAVAEDAAESYVQLS